MNSSEGRPRPGPLQREAWYPWISGGGTAAERGDFVSAPDQALSLFAVGFYPPRDVTGAERSGWNAARQLARRGHRITVFTEALGNRRGPPAA